MRFYIENMTCGGCERSETKAITSVDPTAKVSADSTTHMVEVTSISLQEQLAAALAAVGYAPS